jgi:hypothetical protein
MSGRFIDDQDHPEKSQKAKHGERRKKEEKIKRKKSEETKIERRKDQKWS